MGSTGDQKMDEAILDQDGDIYISDSASETGNESPVPHSKDSGLESPDYSPRSPTISERSMARRIVRFDIIYSPVSSTPMEEDEEETKTTVAEAGDRLEKGYAGDTNPDQPSAGNSSKNPANQNMSSTQGNKEKSNGITIPTITNGSFWTANNEINRLWGSILKENYCEGGHQCEIEDHIKMGPLAPMHGAIPDDVRYDLCWALTMAITTAEDKFRFCLPCRAINRMMAAEPVSYTHLTLPTNREV